MAIELGNLGTRSDGFTHSWALAVNDIGTSVGFAYKYLDANSLVTRAVRWDATSTAATELGFIGPNFANVGSTAFAINNNGTIVGNSNSRAARWDAGTTTATELGNLGVSNTGSTESSATALNLSGTAVGWAKKYVAGTDNGNRAVRWDTSRTQATELGHLGTNNSGITESAALDINDAGTAVGYAEKYSNNIDLGTRAVRWESENSVAVELGNLGTTSSGYTDSRAYAINAQGIAVGYAAAGRVSHAVFWRNDGRAIDLNTLIDPTAGWTLAEARSISDTGWIAGFGRFDPDGAGTHRAYDRLFLIHIPEPCTIVMLNGLVLISSWRFRRS